MWVNNIMKPGVFDVIVVGGGHAGVEAALAAKRVGVSVALITMNSQTIGRMSCNPSIGGLAKGQMVREIDALGGVMGLAADSTGTQYKLLNKSKGRLFGLQEPRLTKVNMRNLLNVTFKRKMLQQLKVRPSPLLLTGARC